MPARRLWVIALGGAVILLAGHLGAWKYYTVFNTQVYLTFHTILEVVSVSISLAVFLMAWYNYRQNEEGRDLLIGLTFMAVGILDLAHALSYHGMPAFINTNSVNKATTYWIAARIFETIGLFCALITPRGKGFCRVGRYVLLTAVPTVTFFVLLAIVFYLPVLPPMYISGKGLTTCKISCEYGIIVVKCLCFIPLARVRWLSPAEGKLGLAILFGIFSEIAFTFYSSAYDTFNLLGHLYKIITYAVILQSLFVTTLYSLYATNRKLHEANLLKEEFLANTNHELRTPLTALMAFSEMLGDERAGALNKIQKDYLVEIKAGGQKLLVLINSLLDLSKIEAGKMEVFTEEICVSDMVDEINRQMLPLFLQKKVNLQWKNSNSTPLWIDRDKVNQIIINLLSNALKFTPGGGRVLVEITTRERFLLVQVSDTGVGIPHNRQKKIFEKFYQVDGSKTRKYKGTGIGLALCKQLATMLGGEIRVESTPGKGSCFKLRVPCYGGPGKGGAL